jgi:hypothetical protein
MLDEVDGGKHQMKETSTLLDENLAAGPRLACTHISIQSRSSSFQQFRVLGAVMSAEHNE